MPDGQKINEGRAVQLHRFLLTQPGIAVPDFDEFFSTIQDEAKLRKVHQFILEKNPGLPKFQVFQNKLFEPIIKKEPVTTPATTVAKVPEKEVPAGTDQSKLISMAVPDPVETPIDSEIARMRRKIYQEAQDEQLAGLTETSTQKQLELINQQMNAEAELDEREEGVVDRVFRENFEAFAAPATTRIINTEIAGQAFEAEQNQQKNFLLDTGLFVEDEEKIKAKNSEKIGEDLNSYYTNIGISNMDKEESKVFQLVEELNTVTTGRDKANIISQIKEIDPEWEMLYDPTDTETKARLFEVYKVKANQFLTAKRDLNEFNKYIDNNKAGVGTAVGGMDDPRSPIYKILPILTKLNPKADDATWLQARFERAKNEFETTKKALLLNKDLTGINPNWVMQFWNGFESSLQASPIGGAIPGGIDSDKTYVKGLANILTEAGIELTEEQKEDIVPTQLEVIGDFAGGFAGIIPNLMISKRITIGGARKVGLLNVINKLKKGGVIQKSQAFLLEAAMEETAMQLAGFEPGTGAVFYGTGRLLGAAGLALKGKYGAILSPMIDKAFASGISLSAGMEASHVFAATVESLNGEEEWGTILDRAGWGDLSEAGKRIVAEITIGGFIGVPYRKAGETNAFKIRVEKLAEELEGLGKTEDAIFLREKIIKNAEKAVENDQDSYNFYLNKFIKESAKRPEVEKLSETEPVIKEKVPEEIEVTPEQARELTERGFKVEELEKTTPEVVRRLIEEKELTPEKTTVTEEGEITIKEVEKPEVIPEKKPEVKEPEPIVEKKPEVKEPEVVPEKELTKVETKALLGEGFEAKDITKLKPAEGRRILEEEIKPEEIKITEEGMAEPVKPVVEEFKPTEEQREEMLEKGFTEKIFTRAKPEVLERIIKEGLEPDVVSITPEGELKVVEKPEVKKPEEIRIEPVEKEKLPETISVELDKLTPEKNPLNIKIGEKSLASVINALPKEQRMEIVPKFQEKINAFKVKEAELTRRVMIDEEIEVAKGDFKKSLKESREKLTMGGVDPVAVSSLFKLATLHLKKGVLTLNEFAKSIGEKITPIIKETWEKAKAAFDKKKPTVRPVETSSLKMEEKKEFDKVVNNAKKTAGEDIEALKEELRTNIAVYEFSAKNNVERGGEYKNVAGALRKTLEEIEAEVDVDVAKGTLTGEIETKRDLTTTERDKKMRGFPKRIREYKEFDSIKDEIDQNPELRYEPQKLSQVKERLGEMTDQQKLDNLNELGKFDAITTEKGNFGVLSGIDLLNKFVAEGRDTKPVLDALSKVGTTLGQLIRQYGEVKSSTPEGAVGMIERELFKYERFLTESQRTKLLELTKADITARFKLREAEDAAKKEFTEDNLKELNRLSKEAEAAYIALNKEIGALTPREFWEIMGTTLQGNLLTFQSLIVNPVANLINIPLRVLPKAMMTPVDAVYSFVTGKPRELTIKGTTTGIFKGLWGGTVEALRQIKTGVPLTDLQKVEIQRGFRPLRALYQSFSGEGLPVTRKGKVASGDRLKKLLEGTIGGPAEVMFRFLNLGDKPFMRAAEQSTIMEEASKKGLKGEELKKFLRFPDMKTQELAKEAGLEMTFQEKAGLTKLTNAGFKMLNDVPVAGGFLKFMAKTQAPYIKTPVNIVSQTLDFAVPELSFAKFIFHSSRRNRREALMNLGKATLGVMMISAADTLFDAGIITAAIDKERKVRNLEYEVMGPYSLNISGLSRFLKGEDPKLKKGDKVINYQRLGIAGAVFGIRANFGREIQKKKEEMSENRYANYVVNLIKGFPEIASFSLEQSFLQGTSNFLEAIKDRKWNRWLTTTFRAITSIPIPNTIDALSRINQEYIPDTKGEDVSEMLDNVIKVKTLDTDDLPLLVNLWGESIKRTPEGRNAWIFQLFDIAKFRDIEGDPLSLKIFNLYNETQDSGVIPSVPSRKFFIKGNEVKLNGKQYQRFLELVGQNRKGSAEKLVFSSSFERADIERKIKLLEGIYSSGRDRGKSQLLKEFPELKGVKRGREGRLVR